MCSHLLTTSFKRIGRQDPAEAGRRGKEFVSMIYRKWFLLGMFLVGVLAPAISSVHAQTFTSFDPPGSIATFAVRSINPAGEITGSYLALDSGLFAVHGFVRDGRGTITSFDP